MIARLGLEALSLYLRRSPWESGRWRLLRRALPWFGITLARESLAWTVAEAVIGFAILGLVLLLLSALSPDLLAGH